MSCMLSGVSKSLDRDLRVEIFPMRQERSSRREAPKGLKGSQRSFSRRRMSQIRILMQPSGTDPDLPIWICTRLVQIGIVIDHMLAQIRILILIWHISLSAADHMGANLTSTWSLAILKDPSRLRSHENSRMRAGVSLSLSSSKQTKKPP